ncbi:MAG: hypothetical protein AABX50_01395 [Nanoarchaeota archaeon]
MKKIYWFFIILLLIGANILLYKYYLDRGVSIQNGNQEGVNFDKIEKDFIKIFFAAAVVLIIVIIFYTLNKNFSGD